MRKLTSPLTPVKATLEKIIEMKPDNYLFEFSTKHNEFAGCMPGQFVELWIPGVGESAISVCSARNEERIQLLVRKVGRLTDGLYKAKIGDWVGLRGPYGRGFPVDKYEGKSLCMVAGGLGIAPIRSLWQYAVDNRAKFKKLVLIYGMRRADDILYHQELEDLTHSGDVHVWLATETPCLEKNGFYSVHGMVTDAIAAAALDSDFEAALCGPPIMYKYAIRELMKNGIKEEQIWVSLERHMKCGVGKCGHCYIGGHSTCQKGPVFNMTELLDEPEAIECERGWNHD